MSKHVAVLMGGWSAERVELVGRTATGPHGEAGHLEDSLVVVRRLT